jgi:hypothetical protein
MIYCIQHWLTEALYVLCIYIHVKCKYIVHCKRLFHPLVREGTPHQQLLNSYTETSLTNGCLTARQTGRLTVGHNITLTLAQFSCETVARWL